MDSREEKRFFVGSWLVTPNEDIVSRDDRTERLEPLAMQVLVHLASRAGEVVSRSELEQAVWKGAVVSYDSVTSTVKKLRKALGDNPRNPRYIATIPKRGYQLVAPLKSTRGADVPATVERISSSAPILGRNELSRYLVAAFVALAFLSVLGVMYVLYPDSSAEPVSLTPRAGDIPALVVLPFADLGGDSEQRHLADGMTEGVITSLSRLSGLRVIARNSAFAFADIGADPREAAEHLGVRYVLQGSMFSAGSRIRVNAKLIDTETGVHLWAERFDGRTTEFFTLQDSVAERTAHALSVRLTDSEKTKLSTSPTTHFGAYDYYLRGRVVYGSLTERESALARAMYRRAIAEDPTFSLGYAGLALTYIDDFRSRQGLDREAAASKAVMYAEQAVALDNTLPQAHFAVGYVRLYGRADHEGAIAEARQALTMNPNYADAYALLSSAYFFAGELDKTLELDREAIRLNPAASFVYEMHLGRRHYLEGRFQEALNIFLIGAAKDYHYIPTQVWLAATHAKLGDLDEAEWAAEQIRILMPEFTIEDWMQFRPYKNLEHRQALIDGLRLAGLR